MRAQSREVYVSRAVYRKANRRRMNFFSLRKKEHDANLSVSDDSARRVVFCQGKGYVVFGAHIHADNNGGLP